MSARRDVTLWILILGALLGLVACGDDDDGVGQQDDPATGDETPDGGVAGESDSGRGGEGAEDAGGSSTNEPSNAGEPNPDGVDDLPPLPEELTLPIIFVHGFAGSAQQYQSQAMRFVANGYPQERIRAFDHDGAGFSLGAYADGVDEMVNQAIADFGVDQVYLVGHSRGTAVSSGYLSDPARAAKVAKYIALDGSPCPAVVPCIAPNQAGIPGQAHVEVATSAESFAMQYEFLIGEPPEVVDIVPQRAPVEISGRVVDFPSNIGRDGTTLELWEIDSETGMRTTDEPHATFEIGADGNWGPVTVDPNRHYEKVLFADGSRQHHFYAQPYIRSTHFVRLLSGDPETSATVANTNIGDDHATIIAIRMREWYAGDDPDLEGDESDVLEISTASGSGDADAVNAIQPFVGNGAIGLHIHDDVATAGESTLMPLPYFPSQAFQSGIDVFMPAADPPDGTITVKNIPRGESDRPQILNIPNWASSGHAISVMFSDYAQD